MNEPRIESYESPQDRSERIYEQEREEMELRGFHSTLQYRVNRDDGIHAWRKGLERIHEGDIVDSG